MGSAIGIPTTRVSDLFVRQQLLRQIQTTQLDLYKAQLQLSTGQRFQLPSEDPQAASRVISIQRLLERKAQIAENLNTNQSYLTATDSALGTVSSVLADVQAAALGALGTTASDTERAAAAQSVEEAIRSLVDTANQKYWGRYLFAGSPTAQEPFEWLDNGSVAYRGNESHLQSYSDVNLLFETNFNGSEVFGAVSEAVAGSADLTPALAYNTRLSDLHGGEGVTLGTIAISDGDNTSYVDLSSAETLGDVAAAIRANSPGTASLEVEVTATGLRISLPDDLITIKEVAGGTTAEELGILTQTPTSTVTGEPLDPVIRETTALSDILGTRASTVLYSAGNDNDILFTAAENGEAYNEVTVCCVDDPAVTAGSEWAEYSGGVLTIHIDAGASQAKDVVAALHAQFEAGEIPFDAELDPLEPLQTGEGLVVVTATATTHGGGGITLDQTSGLQIVNGGQTYTVTFEDAQTVEDLLSILNTSDAGVLAEINETGTAINVRSRLSGSDFAIGENGGTTAADLGIRSFTNETRLGHLNYGYGLMEEDHEDTATDFTITRADGAVLNIDLSTANTIGDVIDLINGNTNNTGSYPLVARLAAYGNGIEIIDYSRGSGSTTISQANGSTAANALGLIPEDATIASPTTVGTYASATLEFSGANNDLVFSALVKGESLNGTVITFQNGGPGSGSLDYDPDVPSLTFTLDMASATAQDIIDLLAAHPEASQLYAAEVAATDGGGSDGLIAPITATLEGGTPDVVKGADSNPLETDGVFTALVRLRNALLKNDLTGIERAVEILDNATTQLSFVRAELGARQQSLDALQERQDTEEIGLQANLSAELDADYVEAASNYASVQVALEAALKTTAALYQLSLFNYI